MNVYTLNVEAMVSALGGQQQAVQIDAELPNIERLPEAHHATLFLTKGRIQSCAIFTQQGRILQHGREALATIQQVGELSWTVRHRINQMSPDTGQHEAQSRAAREFPRRITALSAHQIEHWPRRQKQIFALADGTRSVAQIAHLLSLSVEQVEQTIHDLQAAALMDD